MKMIITMITVGVLTAGAFAEVSLPNVFGSHMVLQREKTVPIWGQADPGEKVTVAFKDQMVQAVADDSGEWRVDLAPMDACAEGAVLTVQGTANTITFNDVLVGEVWLCSGQSNMEYTMRGLQQPEEAIRAAANYPHVRLFKVARQVSPEGPAEDVSAAWVRSSYDTALTFSGVATYFGRALSRELDVPIGLISSSVGGTPAEGWTSPESVERLPFLAQRLVDTKKMLAEYDPVKAQEEYEAKLAEWQRKKDAGEKVGWKPQPFSPFTSAWVLSTLYNGMIDPLQPYAIRGVIWYQGEANESRAMQYHELFSEMITGWREAWGQGDFPFLFVQLANYRAEQQNPVERAQNWPLVREAQQETLALPNTGMAVITDVGDAVDIHPKDKKTVGERLALAARVIAYGEDIVYSGPLFQSLEIQDGKAVIRFDHVAGGLMVKGDQLKGFAIKGESGGWQWGNAQIVGDTVVVSSPDVPEPVAVRYNWADNPVGNLYNKEGLPASLFRTDK